MNKNIIELANKLKDFGMIVYLDKNSDYGIYTDHLKQRVISFQETLGYISFSGNYKSINNGTGWKIYTNEPRTKEETRLLLYTNSPFEFKSYTTLEQYLQKYKSSGYIEFKEDEIYIEQDKLNTNEDVPLILVQDYGNTNI